MHRRTCGSGREGPRVEMSLREMGLLRHLSRIAHTVRVHGGQIGAELCELISVSIKLLPQALAA